MVLILKVWIVCWWNVVIKMIVGYVFGWKCFINLKFDLEGILMFKKIKFIFLLFISLIVLLILYVLLIILILGKCLSWICKFLMVLYLLLISIVFSFIIYYDYL